MDIFNAVARLRLLLLPWPFLSLNTELNHNSVMFSQDRSRQGDPSLRWMRWLDK